MTGKIFKLVIAALLLPVAAGCDHKPLVHPDDVRRQVEVVFDWADAPGAHVRGMTVYFYPEDGGEIYRFDIAGMDGGTISLPKGYYTAVAYNSDATATIVGDADGLSTIKAFAATGTLQTPYFTVADPLVEEPVHHAPEQIYTNVQYDIDLTANCCCCRRSGQPLRITFYPAPFCPNYDYVVEDVENMEFVRSICASLSGMAPSLTLADRLTAPPSVQMAVGANARGPEAFGYDFHTFGPSENAPNILSVYALMKDNTRHCYQFDVTSQVRRSPDPMNVHIRVNGLRLPDVNPMDTIGAGGGIQAAVDGWDNVFIDLSTDN